MNIVEIEYTNEYGDIVLDVYENVVGHQVGGGTVQVVLNTGVQHIINGFGTIVVTPDEETQEKNLEFARKAYEAEQEEKNPTESPLPTE